MESCANCKHKEIPGYYYPCCRCDAHSEYAAVEKAVEIRTHGDRIRVMSDEQLAAFLHRFGLCHYCTEHKRLGNARFSQEEPCDGQCEQHCLEWLKQPVEEEEKCQTEKS